MFQVPRIRRRKQEMTGRIQQLRCAINVAALILQVLNDFLADDNVEGFIDVIEVRDVRDGEANIWITSLRIRDGHGRKINASRGPEAIQDSRQPTRPAPQIEDCRPYEPQA